MMLNTRRARMPLPSRRQAGLWAAFLVALFVFLFLMAYLSARTAAAAPLVDQDAHRQWARDAVATLTARGLVEGYPDGTYKGDRSITRDEAATLLQSVEALLAEENQKFATKEDMADLEQAVNSLHDALEEEGTREDALEKKVKNLDGEVDETARPSL